MATETASLLYPQGWAGAVLWFSGLVVVVLYCGYLWRKDRR